MKNGRPEVSPGVADRCRAWQEAEARYLATRKEAVRLRRLMEEAKQEMVRFIGTSTESLPLFDAAEGQAAPPRPAPPEPPAQKPKKARKPRLPPIPPDSPAAQEIHRHFCPKGPQEPLPECPPCPDCGRPTELPHICTANTGTPFAPPPEAESPCACCVGVATGASSWDGPECGRCRALCDTDVIAALFGEGDPHRPEGVIPSQAILSGVSTVRRALTLEGGVKRGGLSGVQAGRVKQAALDWLREKLKEAPPLSAEVELPVPPLRVPAGDAGTAKAAPKPRKAKPKE